ncbi:interferon alpha-inducible protein 6 [Plakobranchus ocellatus]|uniref:Interferon alpha-inducible protein 6 n=1 Tax=Plakobranchus ocellatus TaxID=259542 RepID=A0AAV4D4I6_9GAST|nr:interferon alpha-inducible protein 6 [Plakobranchus ocellatus]
MKTVIFLVVLIANFQLVTPFEVCLETLAGAALGATAVVFGGPLALGAIGFGASGIGAGSIAAGLMSTAATTGYGGAVIAGLQSAGAAGLGVKAVTAGAAAGYAASKYLGFNCDENDVSCKKEE